MEKEIQNIKDIGSVDISVKRVRSSSLIPVYKTEGSSGMDLHADIASSMALKPGDSVMVPTGIIIALPLGYEAQIRPRSGLALKHCITVVNTPGTIDSDYRGEIGVILINHGKEEFIINPKERIAQMIVTKYSRANLTEVGEVDSTPREDGGFGSTGV